MGTANTIRIPEHEQIAIRNLHTTTRQLTVELGREPTTAELAVDLGITPARVDAMRCHACQPISLHTPAGADGGELGDFLVDDTAPEVSVSLLAEDLRIQLQGALTTLTARESEVISRRFGLAPFPEPQTLDMAGAGLGVSRERVRQIETTAMAKLRHPAHSSLRTLIAS